MDRTLNISIEWLIDRKRELPHGITVDTNITEDGMIATAILFINSALRIHGGDYMCLAYVESLNNRVEALTEIIVPCECVLLVCVVV